MRTCRAQRRTRLEKVEHPDVSDRGAEQTLGRTVHTGGDEEAWRAGAR